MNCLRSAYVAETRSRALFYDASTVTVVRNKIDWLDSKTLRELKLELKRLIGYVVLKQYSNTCMRIFIWMPKNIKEEWKLEFVVHCCPLKRPPISPPILKIGISPTLRYRMAVWNVKQNRRRMTLVSRHHCDCFGHVLIKLRQILY